MTLAPSQILARLTESQVADAVLEVCREAGFRTTSWQDGGVRKTLIRGFSRSFAGASNALADTLDRLFLAPGREGEIAGLWQDLRGVYWYNLPRLKAVRCVRAATYTSAASAPAHVITVGSQFSADGRAFEVTELPDGGALAPGGSVSVVARALVAGTDANVASDATCRLITPYAGASVALDGDPTTEGADRETNARYQQRQDLRWAELTYSVGLRAYELWALTADASIDRVTAWTNHPNPNEILIAIEPGTPAQLANVAAYVAGRSAVNDLPSAVAANPVAQTITATPRIRAGTTTVAEIEAAITAYLDSMPLGGVRVAGAPAGRLLPEKITQVVLCQFAGVESFNLSEPAAPVVLGRSDYIIPTYNITPEWT